MAIYKEMEDSSKVPIKYHRIQAIHSIQFREDGRASLEGYTAHYVDEQTRRDGATPVGQPTRENFEIDAKGASLIKTIIYNNMRGKVEKYIDGSDIIEEYNYRIKDFLDWVSTEDLQAELDKRLYNDEES